MTPTEQVRARVEELTRSIAASPSDASLYEQRGRLYWQLRDIPRCFADYDRAVSLDSASPARHHKQMAQQILSFYNKEMYNP